MFRLFRTLSIIALFCGVLLLGLGTLLLQDKPLLEAATPPVAEDVVATRSLVRKLRAASSVATGETQPLQTDAKQLNSAIRLGARFLPGFRGRVFVTDVEVVGQVSVPVPWWNGRQWLNISGHIPEFDREFTLRKVTVAALDIPPGLAIFAARTGANLVMGDRFGDKVLQAATGMQITQNQLLFDIALGEMGKNGMMRSAFGAMRGNDMPGPDEIESYHRQIRAAMADGRLPQTGSFLPYLQFALNSAYENSSPETLPNDYTAAIFGLAKACGALDFAEIVGRLAFDVAEFSESWPTNCDSISLNNRIDSRRHFITSAALQAASNRGFSVSLGEFKELHDTVSGAGGFDFTDMAANLSGVRMSNTLMAADATEWPALLARLETENDVIVVFDDIPGLMPRKEFEALYGTVESPQYKQMIATIEARIDKLNLHAPQ